MSVKTNKQGYIEIHLDNDFLDQVDSTKELSDHEKRAEVDNYISTLHAITYYLTHLNKDLADDECKFYMLSLLDNMLPSHEQAMRMFNTPIRKQNNE